MIKWKLFFCLSITLLEVNNISYGQSMSSKISPLLSYTINSSSTKSNIDTVLIYFNDLNCIASFMDSAKIKIKKIDTKNKFCKIILPIKWIPQIANLPCIDFTDIYKQPTTDIVTIGYEKKMHGINKHMFNNPSINGQHIVIGVKERKIDIDDIDLQKRSVNSSLVDNQIDQHATTIATLIGGAGNSYHTSRGLANRSQFFSSSFSNLFPDDSSILKVANVSVQNHSYGTAIQNYYGPEARAYDEQLYKNPNFLHVFSSGNAGLLSSTNGIYSGITEYANCTGNFKMAKNVITVGAIDTGGLLLPFSSKGPLFDGRVAPQLVALGANGTSDAAALITGTIALLQQMYQNSHNNQMPNVAIVKSLLYNSADKTNLPLLSYASGYGRLDVNKAVHSMQQNNFRTGDVGNGEEWSTNIMVPNNATRLSVTLHYNDTNATINATKALINNLDLQVEANSITYLPWVLNPKAHKDSLKLLPLRKVDTLNNTEQITIDYPFAGTYSFKVKGSKVITAQKQFFAVAFHVDTANHFSFISPINADDINKNENAILPIIWQSNLLDTNSIGQLFIDYNNSGNWNLLENSIRLNKHIYYWLIPNFEGMIRFKMQTGFGDFYTNEIAIHNPTKLSLLYNCNDSARIVWPRHLFAQKYQIFALTDSAYLKKIAETNDTSFYFIKNLIPHQIFAVQPILANNIHATRSEAVDINLQGVKCFYKQFLVQNIGSANVLQIQLSYQLFIEKLIFEKINLDGSITVLDSVNVQLTNPNYQIIDNNLKKGVNKYRVKLILKNGANYYTEIISTINTGKNNFLLYPTIVNEGGTIRYLQKEFLENVNLLFYFTNGILYKKFTIGFNGEISTKNWQKGIYIYYYLDSKKNSKQVGRIIVL